MPQRPPVSVIVPFHGSADDARSLVAALGRLALRDGDEVLVADNTVDGVAEGVVTQAGFRSVAAPLMRSSYYARNVGAEAAGNAWLLFTDSDCIPPPSLLDDYFATSIPDGAGVVGGEVRGPDNQPGLVPAFQRDRRHLSVSSHDRARHELPLVATANMLVRADALWHVGGFAEGVRSMGDFEFVWRVRDAGWDVVTSPDAWVEHEFPVRLRTMARKYVRYGGGSAWARRRNPAYRREAVGRGLVRAVAGTVVWTLTGRFRRGAYKLMDGVVVSAGAAGTLLGNVSGDVRPPPAPPGPRRSVVLFVDLFPERSETFVVSEARALAKAGHRVRVEGGLRARRPSWGAARGLATWYWEDEGILRKVADTAWLVTRHPGGCLRDLLARRRWKREERVWPLRSLASPARRIVQHGDEHLHAHFASAAALSAQRIAALLGRTFSVTAHAYDIFQTPRNLDEKLRVSDFATTGCDYNVEHLRGRPGAAGARIERVIMGVDPEAFRRSRPYPGGSHVVAVGRLVPKKGYDVLIHAVALIEPGRRPCVTIVGDGPEGAALAALVTERGVEDAVTFAGPMEPTAIRELLETAAVLAMPCVVAPDGDRDSMPVVVKEAMAMEIPVIASDEVGNPEMIGPDRGVLVAPGDAAALAAGLLDLLDRPDAERAAMGVAGRRWVLEHADVGRETERLSALIEGL